MIWHSPNIAYGRVVISPQHEKETQAGPRLRDRVFFRFKPSWIEFDDRTGAQVVGPVQVDTDHMAPDEVASFVAGWGEKWQGKFEKWLTTNPQKLQIVKGKPKRMKKVLIEEDDYEKYLEFKAEHPGPAKPPPLTTGGRAVQTTAKAAGA